MIGFARPVGSDARGTEFGLGKSQEVFDEAFKKFSRPPA